MTEQNKKNSRLQLNEGTIYVDAESIVFKPQAFKACDDQKNFDSSANQEQGLQNHLGN
ncbi:hypothetical protein ACLOE0_02890 [Limosilactobacillus fermentum]|uniref:hypothetical protein n=1 Tax=Limosilactobacillus fermentum TaxID=1613 RepID=UPI003EBD7EB0